MLGISRQFKSVYLGRINKILKEAVEEKEKEDEEGSGCEWKVRACVGDKEETSVNSE